VFKHFDGKVLARGKLERIDEVMLKEISEYPKRISDYFEKYKIRDGVNEIMNLARDGNKYFNDSEPWVTVKSDKAKCAITLNICLQVIYTLAELFEPVIPFSSKKIFHILNAIPTDWIKCGNENLPAGHKLNQAEIIFPKIEDAVIEQQISKLSSTKSDDKNENTLLSYEDFMKIKLKVAEVLAAEKIVKSKKLLKIIVKLENEERQLIAGIAESYKPEDIIGKKVVIVSNLKPAKLMGEESNGMILAVQKEDGSLEVITVNSSVINGTIVK